MQIAMLALFLLPCAPLPAGTPLSGPLKTHEYTAYPPCTAPWVYSAHWRRYPLPASYFVRPFDYRYQFDYFWHAPVRVVPACPAAFVDGEAVSDGASVEAAEVPLPPARIGAAKTIPRH